MTPSDPSYREITLTKGQVALVDAVDYARLSKHRWYACWDKKGEHFYALSNELDRQGRRHTISMHRKVLGLKHGDKRRVDHVEPKQTLDNRHSNLRISTPSQNGFNRTKGKNNTSGQKGIIYLSDRKLWRVRVTVNRKLIHRGYFDTFEGACEAHRSSILELHGEFARS